MSYPESKMMVAVHVSDGTVKIYGHESDGFRPYVRSVKMNSKPKAIQYCADHNDNARKSLSLRN
jgi:hypothetical protein